MQIHMPREEICSSRPRPMQSQVTNKQHGITADVVLCDVAFLLCLVWSCVVLRSLCIRHLMFVCVCVRVRCAAALCLLSVELACALGLSSAFVMCLLLSALCHMPLALCCPVRFYLLFVPGI